MGTGKRDEIIGRVGQRRQVVIPSDLLDTFNIKVGDFVAFSRQSRGVLIKPKRMVDPDDVLTREESVLVAKARREMAEGKSVTLAQLEHDLAHKRPPGRRKTA